MKIASARIRNGVVVAAPKNGVPTRPIAFRVTEEERALLVAAAEQRGVVVGMFLRDLALNAAQRQDA